VLKCSYVLWKSDGHMKSQSPVLRRRHRVYVRLVPVGWKWLWYSIWIKVCLGNFWNCCTMLNWLMSRSLGLCIATISSVIQLEFSPSIAIYPWIIIQYLSVPVVLRSTSLPETKQAVHYYLVIELTRPI
jgi:hypothetical protein